MPVSSTQASSSSATCAGTADQHRADAADARRDSATSRTVQTRSGSARVNVLQRGAAGVVLDVDDGSSRSQAGEVDAGPARHQRQRAFGIGVARDTRRCLALRLGVGLGRR